MQIFKNQKSVESHSLKRQLHSFIIRARQNEQKHSKIQQQELELIGAVSLSDLLERILVKYKNSADLDFVTLVLVDDTFEILRMLNKDDESKIENGSLIFVQDANCLRQLFGDSHAPFLGLYNRNTCDTFFSFPKRFPQSVAMLPLVRHNKVIGSLNLGSFNQERFVSNIATDFLQRLVAIVSICLENATNVERLKRIGLTDPLTKVNNRRFFEQRLLEEVSRTKRSNQPLSCLILDIDHFKHINDTYGHPSGDRVLIQVAARVKEQLRNSDVFARYGGEEFISLLVNTNKEVAEEIAQRIRVSVFETEFLIENEKTINITVSIGVTTVAHKGLKKGVKFDIEAIIKQMLELSDKALYRAKANGRNLVVCMDFLQKGS